MKGRSDTRQQNGTLALYSRRRFLKRALITAAYVTPVVLSYPSTVFATHQCNKPHNPNEMCMGTLFSPGCSQL